MDTPASPNSINLNNTPIDWKLDEGTFDFFGLPALTLWLNPSTSNLLKPLADEIGHDYFRLLVAHSSSLGTQEDYEVMITSLADNFIDGFHAWGRSVSVAGWGTFNIEHIDFQAKEATVMVKNPWELQLHQNDEEHWGCPFIQGKIIGIFSAAFGISCWAEESIETVGDKGTVRFNISPSSQTISQLIQSHKLRRAMAHSQLIDDLINRPVNSRSRDDEQQLQQYCQQLENIIERHTHDLQSINEQLQKSNQQLQDLSIHDHLTGLLNRRYIFQDLENRLAVAKRYETPLTVLMIDIDDFKHINDNYGHGIGDKVLINVAQVIQSSIREADIAAGIGGEEFLVLLNKTAATDANAVADKILTNIRAYSHEDIEENSTVSIGLSSHTQQSLKELLKQTDDALYEAKHRGKNQYVHYDAIER